MIQVERQIANPLAVEGLVTNTTIPKHGIDFKTLKSRRKASLEGPRYHSDVCRTGSIAWWL